MKRLVCGLCVIVWLLETAAAQSTIFLVRHAEKGRENAADPGNPGLSDVGLARAESLRRILKDAGITVVFATEFKRTQETAAVVAKTAGIPLTVLPAKDTPALIAKLKEMRGRALVVGHSNTIPAVIKELGGGAEVTIEETAYDDLFVIITGALPRLIHLHYP